MSTIHSEASRNHPPQQPKKPPEKSPPLGRLASSVFKKISEGLAPTGLKSIIHPLNPFLNPQIVTFLAPLISKDTIDHAAKLINTCLQSHKNKKEVLAYINDLNTAIELILKDFDSDEPLITDIEPFCLKLSELQTQRLLDMCEHLSQENIINSNYIDELEKIANIIGCLYTLYHPNTQLTDDYLLKLTLTDADFKQKYPAHADRESDTKYNHYQSISYNRSVAHSHTIEVWPPDTLITNEMTITLTNDLTQKSGTFKIKLPIITASPQEYLFYNIMAKAIELKVRANKPFDRHNIYAACVTSYKSITNTDKGLPDFETARLVMDKIILNCAIYLEAMRDIVRQLLLDKGPSTPEQILARARKHPLITYNPDHLTCEDVYYYNHLDLTLSIKPADRQRDLTSKIDLIQSVFKNLKLSNETKNALLLFAIKNPDAFQTFLEFIKGFKQENVNKAHIEVMIKSLDNTLHRTFNIKADVRGRIINQINYLIGLGDPQTLIIKDYFSTDAPDLLSSIDVNTAKNADDLITIVEKEFYFSLPPLTKQMLIFLAVNEPSAFNTLYEKVKALSNVIQSRKTILYLLNYPFQPEIVNAVLGYIKGELVEKLQKYDLSDNVRQSLEILTALADCVRPLNVQWTTDYYETMIFGPEHEQYIKNPDRTKSLGMTDSRAGLYNSCTVVTRTHTPSALAQAIASNKKTLTIKSKLIVTLTHPQIPGNTSQFESTLELNNVTYVQALFYMLLKKNIEIELQASLLTGETIDKCITQEFKDRVIDATVKNIKSNIRKYGITEAIAHLNLDPKDTRTIRDRFIEETKKRLTAQVRALNTLFSVRVLFTHLLS